MIKDDDCRQIDLTERLIITRILSIIDLSDLSKLVIL